MKKTIVIKSLKSLATFAKKYAKEIRGGDVIGLVGELGAGKTTFVQLLSKEFGVKVPVRSPTFILLQELKVAPVIAKRTGINLFVHIDAYRLESEKELFAIGFEDYADRRNVAILIEWADRLPSIQWLDHYHEVKFDFGDNGIRILTVEKMDAD